MPSPSVIVVGSYIQDHAWFVDQFPHAGETRRAHAFNTGPGGKGFNQAIASLRQEVATAFVGAIGDDQMGAAAQRFAAEQGLPCRWQVRSDRPTAVASVVVNAQGENLIAISLGANEHLDPEFIHAQSDLFTSAGALLVQLENNLDAIAAALDRAERNGLVRILNPAPVHPRLDAALLQRVDILTPNETEFAMLLELCAGTKTDAPRLARCSDTELHDLARKLPVPTIVITLGAAGCFVSHAKNPPRADVESCYRVSAERVNAIDSTGAGDAFSGALAAAAALLTDQPFRRCIEYANRVAALSTEAVGAASAMPRMEDVAARFATR